MLHAAQTRPARATDLSAISRLHELVFGPGRFARSAYRVREGKGQMSRFCRVALLDGRLVAALRMTEISIGAVPGAVLLGPLAVDPEFTGRGFGRRLISEALDAVRDAGMEIVVLVGDEPYYGRFGFAPAPPGQITFPGPVNPRRVLALEVQPGALTRYRGVISASNKAEAGSG